MGFPFYLSTPAVVVSYAVVFKVPRFSREEKHEKDIDRISDLPDSVLCRILSFLPTEDSVATTILSKRWVGLWTKVPVFVFRSIYAAHNHNLWFLNFVSNVFLMSKAERIRKFTLCWAFDMEFDEEHLRTWIGTAVRRNVQDLSLGFWCSKQIVNLPGCLFGCNTVLLSLYLRGELFLDVPATVYLPCLRILQLISVIYANDDTLRRLFSGCPVLGDLTMVRVVEENIV
ncbi:hypothetical protein PTKIN_Ptkin09bG0032900 [Pterospermum kingtungense]